MKLDTLLVFAVLAVTVVTVGVLTSPSLDDLTSITATLIVGAITAVLASAAALILRTAQLIATKGTKEAVRKGAFPALAGAVIASASVAALYVTGIADYEPEIVATGTVNYLTIAAAVIAVIAIVFAAALAWARAKSTQTQAQNPATDAHM